MRCGNFYRYWRRHPNFCGKDKSTISRIDSYVQILDELLPIGNFGSSVADEKEDFIVENFPEGNARPLFAIKDPDVREKVLKCVADWLTENKRPTFKDVNVWIELYSGKRRECKEPVCAVDTSKKPVEKITENRQVGQDDKKEGTPKSSPASGFRTGAEIKAEPEATQIEPCQYNLKVSKSCNAPDNFFRMCNNANKERHGCNFDVNQEKIPEHPSGDVCRWFGAEGCVRSGGPCPLSDEQREGCGCLLTGPQPKNARQFPETLVLKSPPNVVGAPPIVPERVEITPTRGMWRAMDNEIRTGNVKADEKAGLDVWQVAALRALERGLS